MIRDLGGGELAGDSDLPDPHVAFLGEISLPKMRSAASVAVAPDGTTYITDPVNRLVHKVTAYGDPLLSISVGAPQGIVADDENRVFVSDASTGSVRVFSSSGEPLGLFGSGEGTFGRPTVLGWDPGDDTILVADQHEGTIEVYSTSGSRMFGFGSRGTAPGQFTRPTGIAVDSAGGRYFIADGGNCHVVVYDRAGAFLYEFGSRGSEKSQLTAPGGIALDAAGRIYVSDAYHSIVQVLDTEGKHVSYLGEYGHNYGQLRLSSDAFVDAYNRLLVPSYKSKKVVIYGLDDYTEPPRQMPPIQASLAVMPPTLNGRSRSPYLHAQIGVSQLDVADILVESVKLQGLARDPSAPVSYDDTDGDGIDELILRFSREALLASLPGPGPHTLSLIGEFRTGDTLAGEVVVHVLPEEP